MRLATSSDTAHPSRRPQGVCRKGAVRRGRHGGVSFVRSLAAHSRSGSVRAREIKEDHRMVTEPATPATSGVSVELLGQVDLDADIPGMQGRVLRMRMVTIEPGGVFGPVHTHVDRPGLGYVLAGRITDHRDGGAREFGPGLGMARGPAHRPLAREHHLRASGRDLGRHRPARLRLTRPVTAEPFAVGPGGRMSGLRRMGAGVVRRAMARRQYERRESATPSDRRAPRSACIAAEPPWALRRTSQRWSP